MYHSHNNSKLSVYDLVDPPFPLSSPVRMQVVVGLEGRLGNSHSFQETGHNNKVTAQHLEHHIFANALKVNISFCQLVPF